MRKILPFLLALAMLMATSYASAESPVKSVKSVSEVYGDGAKVSFIVLQYADAIDAASVSFNSFSVDGKTISRIYANDQAERARSGKSGEYVIYWCPLKPEQCDQN